METGGSLGVHWPAGLSNGLAPGSVRKPILKRKAEGWGDGSGGETLLWKAQDLNSDP